MAPSSQPFPPEACRRELASRGMKHVAYVTNHFLDRVTVIDLGADAIADDIVLPRQV